MTEQEKRIEEQTKDAIEVLGFLKKDFENKAEYDPLFAKRKAPKIRRDASRKGRMY